jgi:hypothetical protein
MCRIHAPVVIETLTAAGHQSGTATKRCEFGIRQEKLMFISVRRRPADAPVIEERTAANRESKSIVS